MSQSETSRRYVVQQFLNVGPDGHKRWTDVGVVEADDAGAALQSLVIRSPMHRIEATTYRVTEEALTVNVSINLEAVDA